MTETLTQQQKDNLKDVLSLFTLEEIKSAYQLALNLEQIGKGSRVPASSIKEELDRRLDQINSALDGKKK